MKQYCISYVTKSGITILNCIIDAESRELAISEISENLLVILSLVRIK